MPPIQDVEATRRHRFATRKRRRSYIDGPVLDEAMKLIAKHPRWGPAQIWRELDQKPEFAGKVPTQRTVERLYKEQTPPDTGPWTLEEADGDDAALVLPVLAAVLDRFEGSILRLSRGEAEWIIRLRRAMPDIPLQASYQVARMYLSVKAAGQSTEFIDRIVAGAPWRDPEGYRSARPGYPAISPWLLTELSHMTDEAR